ncbi:MAG: hypothetical protein N2999_03175 [Proteobacteria bacterium]|nr:hypothetical protein [Pseudomonadota bacterium]
MKIRLITLSVLFLSLAYLAFLIRDLHFLSIPKSNPKETIYLSLEMKRREVERAIDLLKEDKTEEAIIFLKDERLSNNVFAKFYLGLIYFETGKEKEGLELIAGAIREEQVLYDGYYPDNVRRILNKISEKITGREEFKNYRHLIDSKLKGGCG